MLNYLENTKIKQNMSDFIQHAVRQNDLQKLLLEFTDIKNEFPFGQLAYQHYEAFGGQDKQAITKLAAGIELLILSADILDDIEDQDKDSYPWMKCQSGIAMNAANVLFVLSFGVFSKLDHAPELLNSVYSYSIQSMQGQHLDMTLEPENEQDCLNIMKLKAGSLFVLPCMLGVILATGSFEKNVEKYAYYLGMAEQLENDYVALFNKKNIDFKRMQTLPLVYLKNEFNPSSSDLLSYYQSEDKSIGSEELKDKLKESGVQQYVFIMRNLLRNKFKEAFKILHLDASKKEKLILFLIGDGEDEHSETS
ncbi:polyprenyl synthetase family protein [Bacillus safensis]|uniref:polyprenyl synthetase family protein n=1 Tax=Bacillus TaxID=1386 RepID=UPI00105F591A|nr:quorum-sensing protein [Bacillus safensis]MBR0634502.1 quorum-sensing protein [Bacillus safensis]TDU13469.1 competence protein ComQ [Bacillus sp. BK450]